MSKRHMRRKGRMLRVVAGLGLMAVAMTSVACVPAFMATPRGLESGTEVLSVRHEGGFFARRKVSMGMYVADNIQEHQTSGDMVLLGRVKVHVDRSVQFSLLEGSRPTGWDVRCRMGKRERGAAIGRLRLTRQRRFVHCDFLSRQGRWEFDMVTTPHRNYLTGRIRVGNEEIEVVPSFHIRNHTSALPMVSGYIFEKRGQRIAAIDTVSRSALFLRKNATWKQKKAVYMSAAALVVYELGKSY